MRVLLVGTPADRARLRAQLSAAAIEVVAEFSTIAGARERAIGTDRATIDGIVLATKRAPDDERFAGAAGESLTPREVQVMELLAEGLSNKTIAARLGISDQTVKFHVASISGKLGAANRTDAVRRAVRRGLIAL
jgi:DNA-binding CsgD family transcriptional regulator